MTPILLKELRPGKWYIVYHANGRRWVRKVSDDKAEAERIRADLEKKRLKDGYRAMSAFKIRGSASALTVGAYADKWIAEIEFSGLKSSTKQSYALQVDKHIKPYFGEMPLDDLTYGRIKEFINDKMGSNYARSKKEGARIYRYSRDSIRIMISTLRAMLSEAVREDLVDANPVRMLGRFYSKAERLHEKPDPFSLEELHAIEAMAGDWLPFLLFQSRTGVRIGEAIALRWEDLDLQKAEVAIRRSMSPNRDIGPPKTGSSFRTVELSPQLVDALTELQRSQREYWFSQGKEMPDWVFCKHNQNPPTYSVWRRAFIVLQRKARIRIRRVHDLRHTWASQMLLAGKPLTWVSQQLGHKSPQITLSIYAHWVPGVDHGDKGVLDNEGPKINGRVREFNEEKRENGGSGTSTESNV